MDDRSEANSNLGTRLQEVEIKCAFLEKESEEYKEAVQTLHVRLTALEEKIRQLQQTASGPETSSGANR
jgi:prefoldin subunit 5